MSLADTARNIIHAALEKAALSIPQLRLADPKGDLSLFGGPASVLDSMALVTFIFILEEETARISGRPLKISMAELLGNNPFYDLKSLAAFLEAKLQTPAAP